MADPGFWLAQGIGAVAAVLGVAAFQIPRRESMLVLLGLSALTWSAHFLLLAAPAAAGINLVTAARNFCGLRFSARILPLAFAGFYVAAAILGWRSPWDLLPLIAVLAGTLAVFRLQGLAARGGFLTGSLLWVVYNIHVGSLPGIAIMLADGASNALYIWRNLRVGRLRGR